MSYDSHKYCNGHLYVSIAMDVKKTTIIYKTYICRYYNGCKKKLFARTICGYYNH